MSDNNKFISVDRFNNKNQKISHTPQDKNDRDFIFKPIDSNFDFESFNLNLNDSSGFSSSKTKNSSPEIY